MAELEDPTVMAKLIDFLSCLLQRVAESNDRSLSVHLQPHKISAFHGLTRPTISIQSYLDRILKYANCSPCCFVIAYVYLDRFVQRQPFFPINSFNVHRLLITSVLIAAKFMDDTCYNNAYYAKVGGISTIEMNFLEVDFLFGLGFRLNVTPTTFHSYYSYLQRQMLLLQPPLMSAASSKSELLSSARALKSHFCFDEDEASLTKQQLAAV
ncbi:Cyclin-U4-1 [Cucurbita argyrosperma subsp. argyrosperma]